VQYSVARPMSSPDTMPTTMVRYSLSGVANPRDGMMAPACARPPRQKTLMRGGGQTAAYQHELQRQGKGIYTSTSRESPPGPLSISYGHVDGLKARAFPPPVLCESTRSTLNIIWSCGLFEGEGVSTSRVV
jgi:hypothetical protein